jgi:SAM-dependent methyltransferase
LVDFELSLAMSEYTSIFDARGGHYNLANHRFPAARSEEASLLLAHLALDPDAASPWLDVAAGGGYLAERARAEGFERGAVACDASLPFLLGATVYGARCIAQYPHLPFADGTFSGAGCLAALHHAEDASSVIAEMLRVIAPGSRAAVGDVAPGSPAAAFLNDFVHRHTDTGHHGRFQSAEYFLEAFATSGGKAARAETRDLTWTFPSEASAVEFSRELFGLRSDTPRPAILAELRRLGLVEREGEARLPWRMVFVSAVR